VWTVLLLLSLIADNWWVLYNASLIILRSVLRFPFVPDLVLPPFRFVLSCFAAPIWMLDPALNQSLWLRSFHMTMEGKCVDFLSMLWGNEVIRASS
jgi:hypothetical protein